MTPAEFRCVREFLGLSAQWLAERLGVNTRTVSRWEQEEGKPPPYAVLYLRDRWDVAAQSVGKLCLLHHEGKLERIPVPIEDMPPGVSRMDFPPDYYRRLAARVYERTGVALVYGKPGEEQQAC